MPVARDEAREALALDNEHARAKALQTIMDRLQRIYAVVGNVPNQLSKQMSDTLERVEQARLSALRVTNPPPEAWIDAAGEMETQAVIRTTLTILAEQLRKDHAKPERVAQLLATIHGETKLRDAVLFDSGFWGVLQPLIDLSPNVRGETIDITDAREATMVLGWHLYRWPPCRTGRAGSLCVGGLSSRSSDLHSRRAEAEVPRDARGRLSRRPRQHVGGARAERRDRSRAARGRRSRRFIRARRCGPSRASTSPPRIRCSKPRVSPSRTRVTVVCWRTC